MSIMLLMMAFTGFISLSSPVNANGTDIISNSNVVCVVDNTTINITVNYNSSVAGIISITPLDEQYEYIKQHIGFGKQILSSFNIKTTNKDKLIDACIELQYNNIVKNISRLKIYSYKPGDGWIKILNQSMINKKIVAYTTHFSNWSIVYEDWEYRMNITIDHTKIQNTLINFPVCVFLNSTVYDFSHAQDNGEDIRFTDTDDNPFFYEIEKYNTTSESAQIWVNITSVSNITNTKFYMYYGNNTATDNQTPNKVWDNNYMMVQHLEEETGAGAYLNDSTKNYYNLTPSGTTYNDTCLIDGGRFFDGSGDYLTHATLFDNVPVDGTIEMWVMPAVNFPTANLNEPWFKKTANGNYMETLFAGTGGGFFQFGMSINNDISVANTAQTSWLAGTWYHIACLWGPSNTWGSTGMKNIINGVVDGTHANTGKPAAGTPTTDFFIGDNFALARPMNGNMEEIRISNIQRNASWIIASYYNGKNNLVFYGEEETKPAPPPVDKSPNSVSFPNLQYEYIEIHINDTSNVTSEVKVIYPSGYTHNYSFNNDRLLYIYGNETGLYNYSYILNGTTIFNGSFIVVTNFAYENYENIIMWQWENILELIFYIMVPILFIVLFEITHDKIYGLCAGVLLLMTGMRYLFFAPILLILAAYIMVIAMLGIWKLRAELNG